MAKARLELTVLYLRQLLAGDDRRTQTDSQLLNDFLTSKNSDAFAHLMKRHGPMVLGICRRILGREHDAEDAFQATFLVLARRATTIRKRASLASWLHGVAYHMANHARRAAARRRQHQQECLEQTRTSSGGSELLWKEARALLDEEIQALPAIYREPFILCCVHGKSSSEVASTLRLKPGTVWSRVARAKLRLRARLEKRGVELSVLLAAAAISSDTALSAVPVNLLASTSSAALECILSAAFMSNCLSPGVAKLLTSATRATAVAQLKAATLAVFMIGFAGAVLCFAAASWRVQPALPGPPLVNNPFQDVGAVTKPPSPLDQFGDDVPPDAISRLGTVRFRHGGLVDQVAFAPDGKTLVTASLNGILHRWDTRTGKELLRVDLNELHRGTLIQPLPYMIGRDKADSLAVSPNGQTLAIACMNNPPGIWDASSGRRIHLLGGDRVRARQIVYSSDGARVAYGMGTLEGGEDDLAITMADAITGDELRRFVGHQAPIERFQFAANDRVLVSSSQDGAVRCWEVATGALLHQFSAISFAVSADGNKLALCTPPGAIEICDPRTGNKNQTLKAAADPLPIMHFAPDGKTLSRANSSGTSCQIANLLTGQVMSIKEPELSPNRRAWPSFAPTLFTRDSKVLIRGYRDGFIRYWDVATGQQVRQFRAYDESVMCLAISNDGTTLASTQHGHTLGECTVRLWDTATGAPMVRPDAALASVAMLAFSPDTRLIAASNWDGTTRIAETGTGKEIRTLKSFGPVAILPGNQTVITGGWERGELRLCNIKTGQAEAFGNHPGGISFLALSPDGTRLVTKSLQLVRLWDVVSKSVIHEFGGKQDCRVFACALSSDTRIFASASEDHELKIWEVASGKLLWKHKEADSIDAVALSPTGQVVVWATLEERGRRYPIRVAEVSSGKILRTLTGDWAPGIDSLAFSSDGRTIFGGGRHNNRVQAWEVATGNQRRFWIGHVGAITALATSPDGSMIASGSADSSVLVWDLTGARESKNTGHSTLSHVRLVELWKSLETQDATLAYDAMRALRLYPKEAIGLFKQHLKPAPLNGEDRLRQGRALEVIEWIGNDQAEDVLRGLAEGETGAWLTQEARAALGRLAMRRQLRVSK